MGVHNLWAELEPAYSVTTWAQLSDSHFRLSSSRSADHPSTGGLRVGIDLSLWLFHVEKMDNLGQDEEGNSIHPGLNADLRCIFYRICRLLQRGILAVFVFDGPNKPAWKRGKYVGYNRNGGGGGGSKNEYRELKQMFELMGMEWRVAAGEAEAELAAMNERGEIDAVLSDDVDSFLFGAKFVIRNMSKALSANQSKVALKRQATLPSSVDSDDHRSSLSSPMKPTSSFSTTTGSQGDLAPATQYDDVPPAFDRSLVTFSYSDILSTTGLCREDMILIALMSGGDYSEGIKGCGVTTAKRLAEAGYGRTLLQGIKRLSDDPAGQKEFLTGWREQVAEVLRTNRDKLLEKKNPSLAQKILDSNDFPNLRIVNNYAHPRVSKAGTYEPPRWERDVDLEGLVEYVSRMFEWGHEQITAKFRNNLWVGILMRRLRRTALELGQGRRSRPDLPSTLVESVVNFKCGSSTDFAPSYSLHLDSAVFDRLVKPLLPRPDPFPFPRYDLCTEEQAEQLRAERKRLGRAVEPPKDPGTSDFRHWIPTAFVSVDEGCREQVSEWRNGKDRKEKEKEEREERKAARAKAKAEGSSSPVKNVRTKSKSTEQRSRRGKISIDHGSESEEKDTSRAIEEIRKKKAAKERAKMLEEMNRGGKGKGKGKEKEKDVFADSTAAFPPSSPLLVSSDIEIVEKPLPASRLRPSKKSASPSSFASFASGKPTLTSHSTGFKKSSPAASIPLFTSTKASIAIPPKRTIRPPPSSDSGSETDVRSRSKHLDKMNRLTKAHTSPSKLKARSRVIELMSSEEEEEEESLDEYLARRDREQARKGETVGGKRTKDSSRLSATSKPGTRGTGVGKTEKGEEKERREIETLVLSD